jgi:hypothetical protein
MKAYRLEVSNVSSKTEEEDLEKLFNKYVKVAYIRLKKKEAIVVSIFPDIIYA